MTVLWLHEDAFEDGAVPTEPVWAVPSAPPPEFRQEVAFAVRREPIEAVQAAAAGGQLITTIHLEPGHLVASKLTGAPFAVDGLDRPWYPADAPLYRPIGRRDVGEDVDALVRWLGTQGFEFEHETGEEGGLALRDAVRTWAADRGFAARADVFDPTWVFWIPESLVGREVHTVDLRVGSPAPTPGQTVFTVGGGVSTAFPEQAGSERSELSIADTTLSIVVDDQEFRYPGGELPSAAVDALSSRVGPDQEVVSLTVIERLAADVVAIPAPALIVDASGATCFVNAASFDAEETAIVEVEPVGGRSGAVFLPRFAGVVLVNPAETLPVASCQQ